MWAKVGELLLYLAFGPLYFFFRIIRLTVFIVVPKWHHRASEFEKTEAYELLEGRTVLSIFLAWIVLALFVAAMQGMPVPIPIIPVAIFHMLAGWAVYLLTRRKRAELVRRGVGGESVRT